MFTEFVENKKIMDFFPTRKLSQDPLENFFGRIRSNMGSNDNPTVEQFCAAYRKVLVNTELTSSALSNCVDQLNILQVSSKDQIKMSEHKYHIHRRNKQTSECQPIPKCRGK